MTGKTVLAALIAGILAGALAALVHYWRLDPKIALAEVYEQKMSLSMAQHAPLAGEAQHAPLADDAAAPSHAEHKDDHAENAAHEHEVHEHGEHHHDQWWKPADGFQRIAAASIGWMLAGAGFALLLVGVSLVSGIPITPGNALVWGLCAFIAVSLIPAAGLAPALPGMPVADIGPRKIWWVATVLASGCAIYLLVAKRSLATIALAFFLVALPFIYGAPQPPDEPSLVPPGLASSFTANSLAVTALFWLLLGLILSYALPRLSPEVSS